MKALPGLDWTAVEARARSMSRAQLEGALADILAGLPTWDANDRATGANQGGFYRDEASVLRAELRRLDAAALEACPACGR